MHILLFIIILAVLVLSHELGHFIVAKRSGVRVDEFGFGFPPKLWGKKVGETTYSINLIPFGGFVKIYGEDNESLQKNDDLDRDRSFVGKSKITQASIIVAGIAFNLILAWILFSGAYLFGFPTSVDSSSPTKDISNIVLRVVSVGADTPAQKAGLKVGDILSSLSAGKDSISNLTPESVRSFIASHGNDEISIQRKRGTETQSISLRPVTGVVTDELSRPAIGISMDLIGVEKLPIHRALYEGIKMTAKMTYLTFKGFIQLIIGIFSGTTAISSVSGPVGIAGLVGDAATLGFVYVLTLAAIISINLAVINLVPFPALDGGRLLFIAIESIKRSPISPRVTTAVNLTGFALLMLFMLVITYHDIVKMIGIH